MVYLSKMVIFHGYVSHNQMVYVFGIDVYPQAAVCSFQIPRSFRGGEDRIDWDEPAL
jgi:hypothetical protein